MSGNRERQIIDGPTHATHMTPPQANGGISSIIYLETDRDPLSKPLLAEIDRGIDNRQMILPPGCQELIGMKTMSYREVQHEETRTAKEQPARSLRGNHPKFSILFLRHHHPQSNPPSSFEKIQRSGRIMNQARTAGRNLRQLNSRSLEIWGILAALVGASRILATELGEVVHGLRCGLERGARTRLETLLEF